MSNLKGLPLHPLLTFNEHFGEPPIMRSIASPLQTAQLDLKAIAPESVSPTLLRKQTQNSFSSLQKESCDSSFCPPLHKNINSKGIWKLPEGSVKPVPACYPLERSSTFVDNSCPSKIAARISDCLHHLSIAASYHNTKAKAKCRTVEGVEFRVRLFSGKGMFAHGIIVEVQRRSSFSLGFHNECCSILDSAEDCESEVVDALPPIALFPPINDNADLTGKGNDGLVLVETLFDRNDIESNILGMQFLCTLTDSSRSGSENAMRNSLNALFCEDASRIFHVVISLVRHGLFPGWEDVSGKEKFLEHLRDLALRVFTNAVGVLADNDALGEALAENPWVINHFLGSLLCELNNAQTKPNEASLAAKCLRHILTVSSAEATSKAFELGLRRIIVDAVGLGLASHARLEQEASRFAIALGCC